MIPNYKVTKKSQIQTMSLENEIEPMIFQTEEPRVTINERNLIIPNELKTIGVENDNNVERIYFEIPRYFDEVNDLSEFTIYINYLNANQEPDKYHCKDVEVENENIVFSWLTSENVYKYKGSIKFIIYAVHEDGRKWNSTLGEFIVLEGLETEAQIIDNYPDIINELINLKPLTDTKALKEYIDAETNRAKEEEKKITSRIDNLAQLEEGSTTGDAELIDGRVGYDGKTYKNIGGAIRGQVSQLSDDIVNLKISDLKDVSTTKEYNEITKAKIVSSTEELLSSKDNAILYDYTISYSDLETSAGNAVLKLFVNEGDVIRQKISPFWANATGGYYWLANYDSSDEKIGSTIRMTRDYGVEIKENGYVISSEVSYILINLRSIYYKYSNTGIEGTAENGLTADIVTVNENKSFTDYDNTEGEAPDYVPVEIYSTVRSDFRIPRYDEVLSQKMDRNVGVENSGKILVVDEFGNIVIGKNIDATLDDYKNQIDSINVTVDEINKNTPPGLEYIQNEYNEIYLSKEVSSIDEFNNAKENVLIKSYKQAYSSLENDANFNCLKLFVNEGDIIRQKLSSYWFQDSYAGGTYYIGAYDVNGTWKKTYSINFGGHSESNYLDFRNNGFAVPEDVDYIVVNIRNNYIKSSSGGVSTNGKEADIVTVNKDKSYTDYTNFGEEALNYVKKDNYYSMSSDYRIVRYEKILGDIESVLENVVGGVV